MGFAALIATSAGEIRYWIRKEPFDIIVIYIVIPLILVGLNRFQVGVCLQCHRHNRHTLVQAYHESDTDYYIDLWLV